MRDSTECVGLSGELSLGEEISKDRLMDRVRRQALYSFLVPSCLVILLIYCTLRWRAPMCTQLPQKDEIQFVELDVVVPNQWGQHSPYFPGTPNLSSGIDLNLPEDCTITFVQILSRHGARYPDIEKISMYRKVVERISKGVPLGQLQKPYDVFRNRKFSPKSEQLTEYGRSEMKKSGEHFYRRYRDLTAKSVPFIRATSNGIEGDPSPNRVIDNKHLLPLPTVVVTLSEVSGSNNTLNNKSCPPFSTNIAKINAIEWACSFAPAIADRLNKDLPNAHIKPREVVELMDICAFDTVAATPFTTPITPSPFCDIFLSDEWHQYSYYLTLDRYYGYGSGNPLAPTLGVGWVNELIARLNQMTVMDETSTNHTLDDDTATFPLTRTLYADFTHDHSMEAIFAGLGLFNSSKENWNIFPSHIVEPQNAGGFSAAWTVPFAARMEVQKMICSRERPPKMSAADLASDVRRDGATTMTDEFVRILVNDRVMPMKQTCSGDQFGRCTLQEFLESLDFAKQGGLWTQCRELPKVHKIKEDDLWKCGKSSL